MGIGEEDLAQRIIAAHVDGRLLPAPVGHGLDAAAAYRVQAAVVAGRHASRRVGWKLGYTSEAMRRQMGIDEPNLGPLHDAMILASGTRLVGGVVQPRVEPELAAVIGTLVRRPSDVEDGVRSWHAALEIVDSVWTDYRFDWALNTADGSSAAFVVLGPQLDDSATEDLAGVGVRLLADGSPVATGSGADAMGDPRNALRWLVDQLAMRGERLVPGDVVITGGLTAAVPLPTDVVVRADFGSVVVEVSRG